MIHGGRLSRRRVDVRKTYKLYIGGAFPRSESGRIYPVTDRDGRLPGQRRAGLPQGRPRRGGGRARRSAAGPAPRRTTGARSSTGSPRCWRAAGTSSSTRSRPAGVAAPPRPVDAAIDRWVWYAGWADKIAQVYGGANPVAGPYFNLSSPEPTGVVGVLAPATVAARPGQRDRPGDRDRQHLVVLASERRRCRRSPWPRCWPPPTCPAVWSTSSPAGRPRSRRGWPRTWTSTRST